MASIQQTIVDFVDSTIISVMDKYIFQTSLYESYDTALSQPTILTTWMNDYTHILPWSTVVLYLLMVFGLPKLLAPSSPSNKTAQATGANNAKPKISPFLKFLMASHNMFLCLLSAAMILFAGLPFFYISAKRQSWSLSICDTEKILFKPSSINFWALIFVYSKFYELLDTLFLIIKNPERPVPFLHYYHHTTVLLFSWYAAHYSFTVGYWFGLINGTVHMFMYYYYFLTELGIRPTWAKPLTLLQISQMFAGLFLNGSWAYEYLVNKKDCQCDNPNAIMISAAIMYASYLYLFVSFFIGRYSKSNNKNKKE